MLSSFPRHVPFPNRPERRAAVRRPSSRQVSCQTASQALGRTWPGQLEDISADGLKLLAARRFEPGTLLRLNLVQVPELLARVVRVARTADRLWVMGCRFLDGVSDEELQALHC